jgi:hypothetical protein
MVQGLVEKYIYLFHWKHYLLANGTNLASRFDIYLRLKFSVIWAQIFHC